MEEISSPNSNLVLPEPVHPGACYAPHAGNHNKATRSTSGRWRPPHPRKCERERWNPQGFEEKLEMQVFIGNHTCFINTGSALKFWLRKISPGKSSWLPLSGLANSNVLTKRSRGVGPGVDAPTGCSAQRTQVCFLHHVHFKVTEKFTALTTRSRVLVLSTRPRL